MTCKNCCYFWQDDDEKYPSCHWRSRCPDDFAPCEEDEHSYEPVDECDYEDEPIDEYEPDLEMGFDPYLGYYTDDC